MDANLWYLLKENIDGYVYNLTVTTIASAAVYYIVVTAVMLVLLFLIAWKRPRAQAEAVAVKYCPNCGTALLGDSAFCTNCGAKQE